jgi:hypothetical protein
MFDSDSHAVKVDNCASAFISPFIGDFITVPIRVRKKVKGIGGTLGELHRGTIQWSFEDDHGLVYTSSFCRDPTTQQPLIAYSLLNIGLSSLRTTSLSREALGRLPVMTVSSCSGNNVNLPKLFHSTLAALTSAQYAQHPASPVLQLSVRKVVSTTTTTTTQSPFRSTLASSLMTM